ncbi:MAG TPA: sigma-70 family RNA polymerase sigma factor [Candidatus Acidoferrales bacterium]
MAITPAISIGELALRAASAHESVPERPEIEREVIELFDQNRNSLLRYALSFGLPAHDGEEVAQETFLALFRHLQMGKSRKNLRGWIFRVAHNLALRKRECNQRAAAQTESHENRAVELIDPGLNPEERVLFSQRQQRLMAIVQALPEQDRCCLDLRAEGLRYREIAAVLGMSLGAVSMSLSRSLARLIVEEQR